MQELGRGIAFGNDTRSAALLGRLSDPTSDVPGRLALSRGDDLSLVIVKRLLGATRDSIGYLEAQSGVFGSESGGLGSSSGCLRGYLSVFGSDSGRLRGPLGLSPGF